MSDDVLRRVMDRRAPAEAQASALRYQDACKKRLFRIVGKKVTTSFVGALARFEDFFGRLWGHGRPEQELSENERRWRELWRECRTEILNNGNNQVRALEAELAMHGVEWERYRYQLPAGPRPPAGP